VSLLPDFRAAALRAAFHALLAALALGLPCAGTRAHAAALPALAIDAAPAYPLAQHLYYLEDPQHALTVADVAAAPVDRFKPAGPAHGEVNFGYSGSAYWLALPVSVATAAPAQWLLEIASPSLDEIEVYQPRGGGGYTMYKAGDLEPFAARPYIHRNFVFPLYLVPGAHTVYVRVVSNGTLTIPATLWRPEALRRHDQQTYALLSVYYGMLLALGLYNLLLFFATRDPVFMAYVAFVGSMAVGQCSLNGFGNQFLWPDWPAWGNVALPSGMSATGFFGALFTRAFLETRRRAPALDRLILVMAASFAVSALAPSVASYHFAAIFTSLNGLIFSAVATACGIYCVTKGHAGARYFLIAWTLLLVAVAVMAMRNMGWLPTTTLTNYSMQIGSAVEMLLLSFALADRINTMRRAKERASREALHAKQAMVDALRRSEQDLELRVAERTRALETANARLREKEQQLEYMARHDALTGLPNRTLLDDRVARAVAAAGRRGDVMAILLADLDGFKTINDVYGHATGDQLLAAVASRLKECLRETDTVARYGGDEFVIVLEDLATEHDAADVAEKLVARMHRPFALGSGEARVNVSIGVACFPRDGRSGEQLLNAADMAMYAAKAAGRDGWRSARSVSRVRTR
jgi:diguanylate cyclase (GGDEF)-like protein